MKKVMMISVFSIFAMILSGCGDKNTITYDMKAGKATASGFESGEPDLRGVGYMKIMDEISKNCNLDIPTIAMNLNTDGKYTTEVCRNGITYKLINAK